MGRIEMSGLWLYYYLPNVHLAGIGMQCIEYDLLGGWQLLPLLIFTTVAKPNRITSRGELRRVEINNSMK